MDNPNLKLALSAGLQARLAVLDQDSLKARFARQNEFLIIKDFLPESVLTHCLTSLPELASNVNRNYIPRHKKGGSVSSFDLDAHAPVFSLLYRDATFKKFLEHLCDRPLQYCPSTDPHSYALYYYTEPGDHIGFHYDKSYYAGHRYTVLLGLIDESSCKLECQLYRDVPDRPVEFYAESLRPGMLVIFNGDKVYHRITPLGENERRIALTLEYLTDTSMHPFRRFMSNMKDAIAYFGFRRVFGGR
jgi:hypothetical protein